jgi:hypothetical protein
MNQDTLQILKACSVAFFGAALSCGLSLLVQRSVNKEDRSSASAGLPIILNFGHIGALGLGFSMLGSIQFSGIIYLFISYAAAIFAVVYFGSKYFVRKAPKL